MNNGADSNLDEFEIIEESEAIENRQRILDSKNTRFPLLTSIWNQTSPLFVKPYLKPTLIFCTIQFGTFFTSNGFYMLYAEVMNRMATNIKDPVSERVMMCDAIMKPSQFNATGNVQEISEVSAFFQLRTNRNGRISSSMCL